MDNDTNRYDAYIDKKGNVVIQFLGNIGSYWREGKIDFSAIGIKLPDVNNKVTELVEKNKVK